jgi:hypothetical protein
MTVIEPGRHAKRSHGQKTLSEDAGFTSGTRQIQPKRAEISIARLPITGNDLFGREEDINFLDDAWANQRANIVTIVAWAGVGKSTLVNHWLKRMAAEDYRSAEFVFGWSFYIQGSGSDSSSGDEFLDAALRFFADPHPRIGTAWEKGERLAKFIARSRGLLVLDGMEPLQNPPGAEEGRLRDPALQALLRALAVFNSGLCVITTRIPVADIAEHERTSVWRRDLEHISSAAGAKLLLALGVKGSETDLRTASDEFGGHCLALTLLGSFLTDAYDGDIRFRKESANRLSRDARQGVLARKIMESYQAWFGEGPELSVLRMLGLFDRPVDEKVLTILRKAPPILGLTESLTHLSEAEWRAIISKLRRARLIAESDPRKPRQLDTHPLVREYFGEQLRATAAWKECNRRLYEHYRAFAAQLPINLREMEPLFMAVVCGCKAGMFREALHQVYLPRIQRGNASFAANVLGARGALLSVLVHFFDQARWDSALAEGTGRRSLTAKDRLYVLTQSGLYLSITRGMQAAEAQTCHERAESLCYSLNRPLLLYSALIGQWRHSLITGKLSTTMQFAKRVHTLAQEQNDPRLMIGAYNALATTLYFLGNFKVAQGYATLCVQLWRSGDISSRVEEVDMPPVSCLCHSALIEWHFGEIVSCRATLAKAKSLANKLHDAHGLAVTLHTAALLGYLERQPSQVESSASELIEHAMHHNFVHWLALGSVHRGWASSVSGNILEGLSLIESGIEDYRATGSALFVPYWLALKAEALHLANRTFESLEAITEAQVLAERSEGLWCVAELHRLRAVFLTAAGFDQEEVEASIHAAIRSAKKQKSISLTRRAEGTFAELSGGSSQ